MSQTYAIELVQKLLARAEASCLVCGLFRGQSTPWERIAREHMKRIWLVSKLIWQTGAFWQRIEDTYVHEIMQDEIFEKDKCKVMYFI